MRVLVALLPLTIALSACSSEDEPAKGTDVSIKAKGEDGETVSIQADGETGKVGVNVPGFDAKIDLPKVQFSSDDFDIDGVKLYPGSTITSMNVNADDSDGKGGKADVRFSFEAPADSAKVSQWFKDQFAKKGITVSGGADALSGKTKSGDPFSISLTADGNTKTKGTIAVTS